MLSRLYDIEEELIACRTIAKSYTVGAAAKSKYMAYSEKLPA